MDLAADELGLDPVEIRRRNLLAPDAFPYTTRTGVTYDVADFACRCARPCGSPTTTCARRAGRRRETARPGLGIGVSVYVEITGGGGAEFGSLPCTPTAPRPSSPARPAHGQGHATSFSMIVADRLGIPLEKITFVQSDTALVRAGGGTGGSRSLQIGGSAVRPRPRTVVHESGPERRGPDARGRPGRHRGHRGRRVRGPRACPAPRPLARAAVAGVRSTRRAAARHSTSPRTGRRSPSARPRPVVEVDIETGRVTPLRHVAVDDCGRILNPLVVAGQQHGGVVQGIAQALWEQFVYDEAGNPLTATLADYPMPTSADTIALEVSNTETPTPLNPLGAKGIGESATIGSTPAVQNAVVDALRHLGVRHVDMPCTPERVWRAIRDAGTGGGQELWREPPAAFAGLPRAGDAETPDAVEI